MRERAVRLVFDNDGQNGSQGRAVMSITAKIGCALQMLNDWVETVVADRGKRPGVSSEIAERMKALAWQNRELRQANALLRRGEPVPAPLVQQLSACGGGLDALEQAFDAHRPAKGIGLVHQSDGGSPYLSIKFTERLRGPLSKRAL